MHKPATSLPWRVQTPANSYNERCHVEQAEAHQHPQAYELGIKDMPIRSRIALAAEVTSGAGEQNAAYIVHAANAYPLLVAHLLEIEEHLKVGAIPMSKGHDLRKRQQALLQKLGELP